MLHETGGGVLKIRTRVIDERLRVKPLDVEVFECDVNLLVLLSVEEVMTLGVPRVVSRVVRRRERPVAPLFAAEGEPATCESAGVGGENTKWRGMNRNWEYGNMNLAVGTGTGEVGRGTGDMGTGTGEVGTGTGEVGM